MKNHLFYGDNLDTLRGFVDVDQIDFDPRFNSDNAYNVPFEV